MTNIKQKIDKVIYNARDIAQAKAQVRSNKLKLKINILNLTDNEIKEYNSKLEQELNDRYIYNIDKD